ncbi:MAG TPA: DUF4388 domain-containing protein [Acidimicrobiia bacterium]
MSLSGNLGFVPLDEVLRLLSRANQRGMVDVRGDGVDGRVFFDHGGITLATTLDDEALASHIRRSETPEGEPMAALLREMAVETIHQLSVHGRTFQVYEDRAPTIAAPAPFGLEELLADARRRYDEWAEIGRIVSDMDALVRLQRDLGERDRVTIDRDSWRLISEIGSGSSVRDLARELGTTDFWAARVAAGLIGESLLRLENGGMTRTETAVETTPAPTPWAGVEPEDGPEVFAGAETSEIETTEPETETVFAEEPLTASVAETEETMVEASNETTEVEEPAVEAGVATESGAEVDPNASWWVEPEPETEEEEQVAEDTEAFLEKVFSGMGGDESQQQQRQEEGYGLLRRRRLGVMRDISNDD